MPKDNISGNQIQVETGTDLETKRQELLNSLDDVDVKSRFEIIKLNIEGLPILSRNIQSVQSYLKGLSSSIESSGLTGDAIVGYQKDIDQYSKQLYNEVIN